MPVLGSYERLSTPAKYVRFATVPLFPYTMHEHFECIRVRKGRVTLSIGETTFTLEEGDISLTASFSYHQIEPAENASIDVLIFSPHICQDASRLFSSCRPKQPYLRKADIPVLIDNLFTTICGQIACENGITSLPEHFSYLVQHDSVPKIAPYFSVLLLELSRKMPMEKTDFVNLRTIQKVLSFCLDNYTKDISRDMVANACATSPNTITQIFTQLNVSFRDYINSLRISEAYNLLVTTNRPIKEIMLNCGYLNQGTFNQNFYAVFHKTPREVRAQQSDFIGIDDAFI